LLEELVVDNQPVTDSSRANRTVKTTLIEPFRQVRFGLYIIAISLSFAILCGALFFYSFYQQYKHVMGIFNIVDPNLQWELITNDVFYANAIKLGILLMGYLGIVLLVTFRLTHRYYGPLVSIERFVDSITAGDYTQRVTIRKKDELDRLTAKLNKMAERLEERHPNPAKFEDRRSSGKQS
jgi:HAMP domain-containing protein